MSIGISVSGETDFVMGDEPQRTIAPLPPLEIDDDLASGRIELALPVYASWDTLYELIAAGLQETGVHQGDFYRMEIADAKLSYHPAGKGAGASVIGESVGAASISESVVGSVIGESVVDEYADTSVVGDSVVGSVVDESAGASVVVSLRANVEPRGWTGWFLYSIHRVLRFIGWDTGYLNISTDHRFSIAVRPAVSEDGRIIRFKNARIMPDSAPLIKSLADDYQGLTGESLREAVEAHITVNLGERLAAAEDRARERVGDLIGRLGGRGLDLHLEIRPVTRLASVSAGPSGLTAKICAAADVGTMVDLGGI